MSRNMAPQVLDSANTIARIVEGREISTSLFRARQPFPSVSPEREPILFENPYIRFHIFPCMKCFSLLRQTQGKGEVLGGNRRGWVQVPTGCCLIFAWNCVSASQQKINAVVWRFIS